MSILEEMALAAIADDAQKMVKDAVEIAELWKTRSENTEKRLAEKTAEIARLKDERIEILRGIADRCANDVTCCRDSGDSKGSTFTCDSLNGGNTRCNCADDCIVYSKLRETTRSERQPAIDRAKSTENLVADPAAKNSEGKDA